MRTLLTVLVATLLATASVQAGEKLSAEKVSQNLTNALGDAWGLQCDPNQKLTFEDLQVEPNGPVNADGTFPFKVSWKKIDCIDVPVPTGPVQTSKLE